MSRLRVGGFLAPHHLIGEHHSSGQELVPRYGVPEVILEVILEVKERTQRCSIGYAGTSRAGFE
jgi:hypothetical protein